MDHLQSGSQRPLLQVPFYARAYDGGDFHTFPARCGWEASRWRSCLSCESSALENLDLTDGKGVPSLLRLFQTWLIVGLLESVLETKVQLEDFTNVQSAERPILSTTNLKSYLYAWCEKVWSGSGGVLAKTLYEAKLRTLNESWNMTRAIDRWMAFNSGVTLAEDVSRSVTAVLLIEDAVRTTLHELYTPGLWYGTRTIRNHTFGTMPMWLRQEMRRSNWCPSVREKLSRQFDYSMQAYAFATGTVRSAQDHRQCTGLRCLSTNLGNQSFKHRREDCDCDVVHVDVEEVAQMLRRGSIPAINIELCEKHAKSVRIKVNQSNRVIPWVSVSHVWSDGLANPLVNAMPACQLVHIHNALSLFSNDLRAESNPYKFDDPSQINVWIDALCIPVGAEYQDVRDYSIANMYKIYKDSSAVLAIDPDFEQLSTKSTHTEVLTKVMISNWSSRLWIYQEGALCWKVYLLGQDCVHDLRKALSRARGDHTQDLDSSDAIVTTMNKELATRVRRFVLSNQSLLQRKPSLYLQVFFAAIRDRTTSRPNDEAVVIATFLDLDVSAVLQETTPERRIMKLMTLLPFIPGNIVFAWGPRAKLDDGSNSWVPQTLLTPHGVNDLIIEDEVPFDLSNPQQTQPRLQCYIHPPPTNGLATFYPGIILSSDATKLLYPFQISVGARKFSVGDESSSASGSATSQSTVAEFTTQRFGLILSYFGFSDENEPALLVEVLGSGRGVDLDNSDREFLFAQHRKVVTVQTIRDDAKAQNYENLEVSGTLLQPRWWLISPSKPHDLDPLEFQVEEIVP